MGYLCWSHIGDEAAPQKPKAPSTATELTATQLLPPAATDLVRDPFNSTKTPSAPSKGPAGGGTRLMTQEASLSPGDVDKLVLSGTYLRGRRRMAVINGAVYAEGDSLKSGNASLGTVAQIDLHRVVLLVGEQQLAISYPEHLPGAMTPGPASAVASSDPVESRRAFAPLAAPTKEPARPASTPPKPAPPKPPAKAS
jgi:hypothetical protein